jgi:2-methylcitrate dehydratase PrpD
VTTERSFTQRLVQFSVEQRFSDLPASAVAATRNLIRDTLGCIIAGRGAPSSRIIAEVLEALGGAPQASALVSGRKLPAAMAAHINAHCGNALDADDTVLYKAHIGSAVVPAALVLAEQHELSGAEFIAAVTLGYEVAGRIGLSLEALTVGPDGKFQFGPVTGYSWIGIGATVAAARLLGLDEDQMHHAYGIAAATLPLPGATRFGSAPPRPMTKYALYGAIAEAGVRAALLAKAGFTGERDVLDGARGLWRVVGSLGCRWDALSERLGESWVIERACYKLYPACRFISGSLDNFFELTEKHRIGAAEIDHIVVRVPEAGLNKLNVADPRAETLVDGGFSLPFMLGVAALGGPPGPTWLSPAMRDSATVKSFARRVSVEVEPSAAALIAEDLRTRGYAARMPCSMEISARGTLFAARSEFAKGDAHPGFHLTPEEHERKFRTFCASQLDEARIETALSLLATLEQQSTLQPLVAALVAADPSTRPRPRPLTAE